MIASPALQRFAKDVRGVAAIEFAFIAPILIVFYMGMTETCQLLMAKRRVDHATAAIADLVAQQTTTAPTGAGGSLTEIKKISTTILAPFPTDTFTVQITSVKEDSAGALKCTWGWPAACAAGSASPITPATPLNADESVVVAQVQYTYTSAVGYLMTSGRTLRHKAELRPRKNDEVLCPTC